jgi:hypothetical protein
MNESFEKLVFIIGCPRSGTTKLAELLNNHPDIFCSSETHFFNTNWGFSFLSKSFFELTKDVNDVMEAHISGDNEIFKPYVEDLLMPDKTSVFLHIFKNIYKLINKTTNIKSKVYLSVINTEGPKASFYEILQQPLDMNFDVNVYADIMFKVNDLKKLIDINTYENNPHIQSLLCIDAIKNI